MSENSQRKKIIVHVGEKTHASLKARSSSNHRTIAQESASILDEATKPAKRGTTMRKGERV